MSLSNPAKSTPSLIILTLFVILLVGSQMVYSSKCVEPFRDSKDIFQTLIIVTIVVLMAFHRQLSQGWTSGPDAIEIVVGLIVFHSTIVFYLTPDRINAVPKVLNILLYSLFLLMSRRWLVFHRNRPVILFISVIVGVGFLTSLYGILQFLDLDFLFVPTQEFDEIRWVVSGFIGQQTLFAGILAMVFPLAACMGVNGQSRLGRWTALIASGTIFTTITLTHTRAAVLASFGALGFGILISGMRRRWSQVIQLLLYLIAAILIFFVLLYLVPSIQSRMTTDVSLTSSSIHARTHYWMACERMIRTKPIMGFGLGRFPFDYRDFQIRLRQDGIDTFRNAEFVTHPHNEFLLIWIETGLIGLILAISFIGLCFTRGYRLTGSTPPGNTHWVIVAAMMSMTAGMIDACFSFPFHIASSAMIMVIMSAIIMSHPVSEPTRIVGQTREHE